MPAPFVEKTFPSILSQFLNDTKVVNGSTVLRRPGLKAFIERVGSGVKNISNGEKKR